MAEWTAFDRVDPWSEARADLRAGIISSVIANVNRGKKSKSFAPKDFMPYAKIDADRQRLLKRPDDQRDWASWRTGVRGIFAKTATKKT